MIATLRNAAPIAPLALALGALGASGLGAAERAPSAVTLDGEPVPEVLLRGYRGHAMPSEDVCPPHSDAFVREQVVRRLLLVREGEARGLELDDGDRARLDGYLDELAALPEGDDGYRARTEYLALQTRAGAHLSQMVGMPTHEEAIEAYRRLIRTRHPDFVDVPLVRRTTLELETDDEARRAESMIAEGVPVEEIAERLDLYLAPGEADRWITLDRMKYYEGDGEGVETGAWLGPFENRFHRAWEFVHERRTLSRLRPNLNVDNTDRYALREARFHLLAERQDALVHGLRDAAEVRVDGEPVARPESFEDCPDRP